MSETKIYAWISHNDPERVRPAYNARQCLYTLYCGLFYFSPSHPDLWCCLSSFFSLLSHLAIPDLSSIPYNSTIVTRTGMESFELEYSNGLWLAPLKVLDELYDTLLRLPAKGQDDYITLGSRDSDIEICCATKQSRFTKEPYAYTEAQAQCKLSARRDKGDLSCCEAYDQGNSTESPVVDVDPAAAKTASETPANPNSSKSLFAATEAEAVHCLRERGYIVAPPYPSASDPGSIMPPPPYALHLPSSQPARSITRETEKLVTSICKRKRDGDRTVAQATSSQPTPIQRPNIAIVARDRESSGEPEIEVSDADDDDDDVLVSAPQRKKRRTTKATRNSPLQKPITPPRCTKTKKGTLTSTISEEAAKELNDIAQATVDSPPTGAEGEADVPSDDEGGSLAADERDQTVQQDSGE